MGAKKFRYCLFESYRELESQRLQLQQANVRAHNAHRQKNMLCGEFEMRNSFFQESRTKDCREIEELRNLVAMKKVIKGRQAKLDEWSMKQQRNPQTVSQLLA